MDAVADLFARIEAEGREAFAQAPDAEAVERARIAFLSRGSGRMNEAEEAFRAAPGPAKRELGARFNALKQALKDAFEAARARVAAEQGDALIDLTLPRPERRVGSVHPISQVGWEVEQVFASMGYEVIDGPHVELDENNFGRLNIPDDHPARDLQDTFWLANGKLLRTHTSAVQSRTYPVTPPPFRRVVVGKVFRYEAVDATHDNTFTQVEGFAVDRDLTVAHLVGTIRTMIARILKRDDVEVRLRPSYFPFVEPGFEVDVRSASAPEGSRFRDWVELLGCGMIHPRVLEQGGIDPERWQGFAFGMGLERLCMIRHGIADIRLFNGADLRSLRQFGW